MPCPTPEQTASRKAAQENLKSAAARDGLSPALLREAQASLASALSLSDLLSGKRA